MKRNVVEDRKNVVFSHMSDKSRAFFQIFRDYIEHMRIVNAVFRDYRQMEFSCFFQRLKSCFVLIPHVHSAALNLVGLFQLRPKIRRIQIARQIA